VLSKVHQFPFNSEGVRERAIQRSETTFLRNLSLDFAEYFDEQPEIVRRSFGKGGTMGSYERQQWRKQQKRRTD